MGFDNAAHDVSLGSLRSLNSSADASMQSGITVLDASACASKPQIITARPFANPKTCFEMCFVFPNCSGLRCGFASQPASRVLGAKHASNTQFKVYRHCIHCMLGVQAARLFGDEDVSRPVDHKREIKMAQHLDSRCVLLPAPWVPGTPTKRRLESRFCNKEV